MSTRLTLLVALFLAGPCLLAEEIETITAKDGRQIQGVVEEIDDQGMTVRCTDGKKVTVTWPMLDDACFQKFVVRPYVDVKFDKFTGRTTYGLKEALELDEGINLRFYIVEDDKAVLAGLLFTRVAGEWRWLRHHELNSLVNGARWSPQGKLDTELLSSGNVRESLTAMFGPQELAIVAAAKSLEFRVGLDEFALTKGQRLLILALYTHWQHTSPHAKKETTAPAPE